MFTYWDVSEDEDSGYYGENGNPANSLHFEITDGTNGLVPTYGYVIRHNGEIVNSAPSTTFDDYWTAKDAMTEALPIDLLTSTAPDYDPSIYEKLGERKMSAVFWGKAPYGDDVNSNRSLKTSSSKISDAQDSPFDFWDKDATSNSYSFQYGIPYSTDPTDNLKCNVFYVDELGCYTGEVYFCGNTVHVTSYGTFDEIFSKVFDFVTENATEYITARLSHVTADEDSLSDDLDDMNNDDLTEDDVVPDAIASRRDIRKSDRELVFWNRDVQLEMAFERYGIENDETHSLVISVSPAVDGYGMEGTDLGFDAVIQYPAYGFYGTADTVSADTVEGALELAEDFCLNHAMEYLNFSDVTSSVKKGSSDPVLWGGDFNDYEGVEHYGEYGDNSHSLELNGEGGWADDEDDYDYQVHVLYPTNTGSWNEAYVSYGETLKDAFDDAEKWCLENGSEYLICDTDAYDVDGNRIVAKRTFKTAKRKWNARERLALINEEKLIDDEFDDLI